MTFWEWKDGKGHRCPVHSFQYLKTDQGPDAACGSRCVLLDLTPVRSCEVGTIPVRVSRSEAGHGGIGDCALLCGEGLRQTRGSGFTPGQPRSKAYARDCSATRPPGKWGVGVGGWGLGGQKADSGRGEKLLRRSSRLLIGSHKSLSSHIQQ